MNLISSLGLPYLVVIFSMWMPKLESALRTAFPCTREGYFTIAFENQQQYCPENTSNCDYVLCSYYPDHGVYIRVFYQCPQDTNNALDEYEFHESSQSCVKRLNPIHIGTTTLGYDDPSTPNSEITTSTNPSLSTTDLRTSQTTTTLMPCTPTSDTSSSTTDSSSSTIEPCTATFDGEADDVIYDVISS